jgi:hypothetical protein
MKNIIRQILKEEVEEVEEVSLSTILTKLKKLYPKLDYCVSEDGNRLKIWTFYMSSLEDMGADADHPEEFTESGVWIELSDNGRINIGTFNDFRNHDGTYYDIDTHTFGTVSWDYTKPRSIFKNITDVLDYELNVESGITGAATKNYEGRPDGESGFDWRKC